MADSPDVAGLWDNVTPHDAVSDLLRNIFGAPEHRDRPPFTHTLRLPETEEEMAAEPPPSFTLSEDEA